MSRKFCDVVGSSDVLEQHAPNNEQDQELLNPYNHLLKVQPTSLKIFKQAPSIQDLKNCIDKDESKLCGDPLLFFQLQEFEADHD